MKIQEFLKNRIKESGLTYDELGEELGCSRQNVWQIVNQLKSPSYDNIERLLDILGYKIKIIPKEKNALQINNQIRPQK